MSTPSRLRLEVITPGGVVFRDDVDYVEAPAVFGYIGILPGHAPLLYQIRSGQLQYRQGEEQHYLAVHWGFLEVLDDTVTVLAETAERPQDIDLARAESALNRAKARLEEFGAAYDVDQAQQAVARAEARLKAAEAEAGAQS
ncbi:MAG: F0F1 ATP synthase subunit epsilon [Acidobacteriota bacterium]|nr:F0F1 ATP synthase subunit epsilon [Acidobacteriota bacterium]